MVGLAERYWSRALPVLVAAVCVYLAISLPPRAVATATAKPVVMTPAVADCADPAFAAVIGELDGLDRNISAMLEEHMPSDEFRRLHALLVDVRTAKLTTYRQSRARCPSHDITVTKPSTLGYQYQGGPRRRD